MNEVSHYPSVFKIHVTCDKHKKYSIPKISSYEKIINIEHFLVCSRTQSMSFLMVFYFSSFLYQLQTVRQLNQKLLILVGMNILFTRCTMEKTLT